MKLMKLIKSLPIKFLYKKFCKNKFLILLFLISSLYFIFQHLFYLSWDYSVYILNAKYWFSNGNYLEIMRPPLASVLIAVFSLFKFYNIGKYIYLAGISLFYFIMCIRLADRLKINRLLFYVLCLNPYALVWGLYNGSELLSLALLGWFVIYFLEGKNGGLFLGLAFLARYTMLPFGVLLLFYKKPAKIMRNAVYFAIPVLFWLAYNQFAAGNFLTSIANSYFNNILSRQHIIQQFDFLHILLSANIMLLFSAYFIYRAVKEREFYWEQLSNLKINVIMLLIIAFTIYGYAGTPFKDSRYLFNLTLPFAYFSAKAFDSFKNGNKNKNKNMNINILAVVLGIIFLTGAFAGLTYVSPKYSIIKRDFEDNIAEINRLDIKNCSIRSDAWPLLNYYGYKADFNKKRLTEKYIENGEFLVLFPNYGEYRYDDLQEYENKGYIKKRTADYIVLGNNLGKCRKAIRVYHSSLEAYNESLYLLKNQTADINPYNVLFGGFKYDVEVG